MDEMNVRTMLAELADTGAPPQRFDIAAAIRRGRRNRRWRRAGIASSSLAIAIAAVTVVLATAPRPGTTTPAITNPHDVPSHFNPFVPYASFGWLPPGVNPSGPLAAGESDTQSVWRGAEFGSAASGVDLVVYARGTCTASLARPLPLLRCQRHRDAFNNSELYGPVAATSRAPRIDGRPAFWGLSPGKSIKLMWEYAPGAWSVLTAQFTLDPLTNSRVDSVVVPAMPRIAANVRYGDTTPVRFPFWITGIPHNWAIGFADFFPSKGMLRGEEAGFGPGAGSDGVSVSAVPGSSNPITCQPVQGDVRLPLDGTTGTWTPAFWRTPTRADHNYQGFCASDVDGLLLEISTFGVPANAYSLAKSVHLLGTNTANWTTSPIR